MRFALKTYYRLEFLPAVVSFVGEIARCLGATTKEISELSMASEEAGAYIIERYPNQGSEEQFEVVCEVLEDGLRVVFSNMGLPVDPGGLPKYEVTQPEETIDGLGLFLIEKLVDHFEFVNQGRAGWRTVLLKRLSNPKVLVAPPAGPDQAPASSREKLQVRLAGVEHVPGIVELAYRNYGYSYSKEVFYYADRLQDAMEDGRVTSYVALNAEGKVVGQMAILRATGDAEVAEYGALMVQPEYRRSMGLLQLIKAVARTTKGGDDRVAVGEANLVTTHTQSQKVCSLFNFSPMALKLSVHGRARFVKLAEDDDAQRETLLHAVTVTRDVPPVRLFVPSSHVEISRRLFENSGLSLEIPVESPPLAEHTDLAVETHAESELAVLSLRVTGEDFASVLRRQLFDQESDGIKTVFVRFPAWLALPETLEDEVRRMRLFFCGWVVESPDRWWLLYTRLYAQRFDFSRIQLCDPVAIELQTYVERCYQEAIFS